jgi:thiol:disulfide interchange protein DsbD
VHLAAAMPDSLHLVWRFALADQWYLYSPYRNDTGFPPSISLELPAGWTAGPLRFPIPERKILPGGILDHIHPRDLVLTQTVTTGGQPLPTEGVKASLFWLACRELCVPGQATLIVPVVGEPDLRAATLWNEARRSQPIPLPAASYQIVREASLIRVTVPGASRLEFIPAEDGPLLENLLRDGVADGQTLTLHLRPGPDAAKPLTGLLSIDHNDGRRAAGTIHLP